MTSVAPPTEFFPGIDFNPSFYNLGQSAVTLDYLNSNFLRSTGYAISRAQFTLFNGTVDINENLDVSGNINASAYLLNGVPFTPSQWTPSVNDIYYTTGNVGIGKTNPTYKLDVSGNINCNAIFRSGTELTQYTDTNVRTVLSTSAGTNMTWNTGTNKFDVAAPYTDTNVRTVLSTSAGTNMTWNTGTNKFDVSVVFPPSYTDTNVRTVLSNSAGTNMTWNTGTNKFDVAVTSYTLPTAGTGTGGTLGGVKVDGTTISIDASTGVISRTGNTILLNATTTGEYYGWTGLSSGLFRVGTNNQYSTGSIVEDIVLRSNGDVLLQSGIGNYGTKITTSNNILMRNSVGVGSTSITSGFALDVTGNVTMRNAACIGSTAITSGFILDITGNVAMRTGLVVGGTAITSGYTLDVKGDVITSGNINFANTSRSLFWGGTNSSLARAGAAGQYSSSAVIDDIVLRSGNRLLLQSGTGVAGMVINTDNNVFIGASTNSSDDGNVNIAIPDSTFYVRGPRTIGSTTNISFRGGLEGNSNGKVRIWLSSDAAHSSYIESHHTGNGFTNLSFGTSGGNVLPTERLKIWNNGAVGIQGTGYAISNNFMTAGSLTIGNTTQNYGGGTGWTSNTAGLMIECLDSTEIVIHDAGTSLHSLMQYSTSGRFTFGRNMGNGDAWLGIGVLPAYKLHVKCNYNDVNRALHLDAGDDGNPEKYTLTIWAFVIGAGQVGWRFKTQSATGGSYTPIEFTNDGTIRFQSFKWHTCSGGNQRFYYANNSTTYLRGHGSGTVFEYRNGNDGTISQMASNGQTAFHFLTIPSLNTDYIGVNSNTSSGALGYYYMHIIFNTFTGFHRCYYEDDDIFNNDMSKEDIDIFKNNYSGRIVISTGKIKTDLSRTLPKEEEEKNDVNRPINYEEIKNENPNVEWYSGIDKDGITIEEAIPIVQLCRIKKDKRVYGVLGSADRKTNNKNRLIVNSVGEGAICVCNTNGNIENGDYIQSSELLGYGERQDDDLLHNYTVAKAVMDCTFELDSPYYQCYELVGGIRVAFIACTYHCG